MESTVDDLTRNYLRVRQNPYSGRGIIIGLDQSGMYMVQVYWLMGRSESSRKRIFVQEGRRLRTSALGEVTDPLTVYAAMDVDRAGKNFIVSNGSHTEDAVTSFNGGGTLDMAVSAQRYEPDPSHTPRITGVCSLSGPHPYQLSIVRKSDWNDSCEREVYSYDSVPRGVGLCIHTYAMDGNPLPIFDRKPYRMPLFGNWEEIRDQYWGALNDKNRVALAVRFIHIQKGMSDVIFTNKYEKLAA